MGRCPHQIANDGEIEGLFQVAITVIRWNDVLQGHGRQRSEGPRFRPHHGQQLPRLRGYPMGCDPLTMEHPFSTCWGVTGTGCQTPQRWQQTEGRECSRTSRRVCRVSHGAGVPAIGVAASSSAGARKAELHRRFRFVVAKLASHVGRPEERLARSKRELGTRFRLPSPPDRRHG